jgi:hypothetical protein
MSREHSKIYLAYQETLVQANFQSLKTLLSVLKMLIILEMMCGTLLAAYMESLLLKNSNLIEILENVLSQALVTK